MTSKCNATEKLLVRRCTLPGKRCASRLSMSECCRLLKTSTTFDSRTAGPFVGSRMPGLGRSIDCFSE